MHEKKVRTQRKVAETAAGGKGMNCGGGGDGLGKTRFGSHRTSELAGVEAIFQQEIKRLEPKEGKLLVPWTEVKNACSHTSTAPHTLYHILTVSDSYYRSATLNQRTLGE